MKKTGFFFSLNDFSFKKSSLVTVPPSLYNFTSHGCMKIAFLKIVGNCFKATRLALVDREIKGVGDRGWCSIPNQQLRLYHS